MKFLRPYSRYYLFLFLVLLFSIPFYIWGAIAPVNGIPFGLPISFLMIFVPFTLSIIYQWKDRGMQGIRGLFLAIFDIKKIKGWSLLFSLFCMPIVLFLSYIWMQILKMPLPGEIVFPIKDIPLMALLYFLGAIPEEFGWTYILTEPITKQTNPIIAGVIIGGIWAVWHIIPWSWAHPVWWIMGMILLDILMRIGMILSYLHGGRSLFSALVFHVMINISMGVFPNYGSHTNSLVISVFMMLILLVLGSFLHKGKIDNSGLK